MTLCVAGCWPSLASYRRRRDEMKAEAVLSPFWVLTYRCLLRSRLPAVGRARGCGREVRACLCRFDALFYGTELFGLDGVRGPLLGAAVILEKKGVLQPTSGIQQTLADGADSIQACDRKRKERHAMVNWEGRRHSQRTTEHDTAHDDETGRGMARRHEQDRVSSSRGRVEGAGQPRDFCEGQGRDTQRLLRAKRSRLHGMIGDGDKTIKTKTFFQERERKKIPHIQELHGRGLLIGLAGWGGVRCMAFYVLPPLFGCILGERVVVVSSWCLVGC